TAGMCSVINPFTAAGNPDRSSADTWPGRIFMHRAKCERPVLPLSARDLIAVQQLLGHAKPETTAVGARVPDRALLTAVRATSGWRP
ncbi:MAG: hypothetical protein ACRDPY_10505, partial [Streptosporangiaceae bacterium]